MGKRKKGCGCLGLLVSLVLAVAIIGGVFWGISYAMRSTDTYNEALKRARANPAVTKVTGKPIEDPLYFLGSVELGGAGGRADFTMDIEGPKGEGTLTVVAVKMGGKWKYSTLAFDSTDGKRVDLRKKGDGIFE